MGYSLAALIAALLASVDAACFVQYVVISSSLYQLTIKLVSSLPSGVLFISITPPQQITT